MARCVRLLRESSFASTEVNIMMHPFEGLAGPTPPDPSPTRRSALARMLGAAGALFGLGTAAAAQSPRPRPTTQAIGEEGGRGATTYAVGEEGGRWATTYALGEEGGYVTTYALGEEGGWATTYALGEEGGRRPTTQALGEEGGRRP
jgi:hypothetical protein